MKKIQLLVLIMLGFTAINCAIEDYSKISVNELNQALINAVKNRANVEVKRLLQAGADGSQQISYDAGMRDWDVNMTTSLIEYAAKHGCVDIVKELKISAKNDDINKALILAVQEGHLEVVKALIQAKPKSYLAFFRALMQAKPKNNVMNEALILAAKSGNPAIVIELIQAGADVNYVDEHGYTALIGFIGSRSYKKTENSQITRAQAIAALLKAKAKVNHVNKFGDTALILAIKNHDIEAVEILLKAKEIDVNCANNYGSTPAIVALNSIQTSYIAGRNDQYNDCLNSQKIVATILKAPGVNLHHANKNGETAMALLKKIN